MSWLTNHRLDIAILILGLIAGFLAVHSSSVDSLHETVRNFATLQEEALEGSTRIIAGEDETYLEAVSILRQNCKTIFLMQRSATLILGPEAQLPHEREFLRSLLNAASAGADFYQVVSLQGIHDHLSKSTRYFSAVNEATARFELDPNGRVLIKAGRLRVPIKQVRKDTEAVKADRQARILLVEHVDGTFEGLIVFDIGGLQSCVRIHGSSLKEYLTRGIDFYRNSCDYVSSTELEVALSAEIR